MAQLPALNSNSATMTSREMADLTEKRHDSVKRTIEMLSENGTISKPQIVDGEKSANGVVEKIYLIGKRDSYIIVAQLSPEFTAKLVDRWQELEAQQAFRIPQSFSAALRLTGELQEQVEHLQLKAKENAPRVEFANAVRRMEGACKIGEFGKVIGIGQNKLFAMLRQDEILMHNNLPYQRFIDSEYFVVIEQTPYTDRSGKAHPTFTTMVTGKGQVWLEKKCRDF